MRRLALGLATVVLVGVAGAGPASGEWHLKYAGGCGMHATNDPTPSGKLGGSDVWSGELHATVVVYADPAASTAPVSADVECVLRVNGILQDSARGSGTTLIAFADTTVYVAQKEDVVEVCTTVDFGAASGQPAETTCENFANRAVPTSREMCGEGAYDVRVCAFYASGAVFDSYDLYSAEVETIRAAGWLDLYEFQLPSGGVLSLPCIVLDVDTTTGNACASAGGTQKKRYGTLVNRRAAAAALSTPIGTVEVCHADLVFTVMEVGVSSHPGFTICGL